MKIALCGNPNVGKTTLFNRLTHSDAPVGNWHGVTVDVLTKRIGKTDSLTDLPGAYSLTARTAEERVTCEQILYGDYDVVVYVAEVNNLRRNLYMLAQIAEAGKRAALVVNMMDEARGKVDLSLLSERLGIPVVGASSKSEKPKTAILKAAQAAAQSAPARPNYLTEPDVVKRANELKPLAEKAGLDPVFVALKIEERDCDVMRRVGLDGKCEGNTKCGGCANCGSNAAADRPAILRYRYIDAILKDVIEPRGANVRTRKADKILLGKAALPIFFMVMAALLVITIEAGKPLSDLLAGLIARLAQPVAAADLPPWVISLICDGVIAGVGAVLAFLPQVVILYLLTAILQDSGYMSRVAFVTDDFFKKIGLSGRAAFSVILGLGCSATAVLTTRGIAGEDARRRAAFVTPFCPCSARLAVFTAIAAYFDMSGLVVAAMYAIGFAAAVVVLKITVAIKSRGKQSDDDAFIMEMPPYRLPQIKRVMSVVWRNVLSFASRVGSVVLGVSVIMWALCNFSVAQGFTGGGETSIMNTFARIISPVFAPVGFGNWRAVTALISGIAAKETVISVIASLGGMGEVFGSPTAATSFMIFVCLYVPCVATVSALAKENGGKSAAASVATHTVAAYLVSLVYYQSAALFEAHITAFIAVWSSVAATIVACAAAMIFRRGRIKKRAA